MNDSLLQKLANIAIVRQHINHVVNTNTFDKKNINSIQKVGRDLDAEFAELLISQPEPSEVIITTTNVIVSADSNNELNSVKTTKNVEAVLENLVKNESESTRPTFKRNKAHKTAK